MKATTLFVTLFITVGLSQLFAWDAATSKISVALGLISGFIFIFLIYKVLKNTDLIVGERYQQGRHFEEHHNREHQRERH